MADLSEQDIDAALARGRDSASDEIFAASARYDREARRVIVDLSNKCTFAFPPELAHGLATAADEELAQIQVLGAGYGLHWPDLDVDLSVPGLLVGRFGTASRLSPSTPSPARRDEAKDERSRRAG